MHFFDISTSKSGPDVLCFVHFDLEMCFAPQRRALFSTSQLPKAVPTLRCFVHFHFEMCFVPQRRAVHFFDIATSKSGPRPRCFVHFDLQMCFAPHTACNFSSLIWPAGSAPAALASLLFNPPEPQIIGKTQFSRLSYLFSHLHLLSSYSFSSTLLSSNLSLLSASSPASAFHLSILSEV